MGWFGGLLSGNDNTDEDNEIEELKGLVRTTLILDVLRYGPISLLHLCIFVCCSLFGRQTSAGPSSRSTLCLRKMHGSGIES
jgi:hypothetical protein